MPRSNYASSYPKCGGSASRLAYFGIRPSLDPHLVFLRSLNRIVRSVRRSQFNHWIPWTLTVIGFIYGGNMFQSSRGFDVAPRLGVGCFSRLYFLRENPLLAPVSIRNDCLVAPCSQLQPPRIELGHCGQIRSHA